jgi:2-oxoglutarate dehydrogenase E1 component
VLMCSGKIYYELEERRAEAGHKDVAIIRLEQLYPLAPELLKSALSTFREGTDVCWVQEEPENMGAWPYLIVRFGRTLFDRFPFQGMTRPASATPATGSHRQHKQEQKQLLDKAFGK